MTAYSQTSKNTANARERQVSLAGIQPSSSILRQNGSEAIDFNWQHEKRKL